MFQKGSPYLEDVNNLIDLAKQIGLIDAGMRNNLPNATECINYKDIQDSHRNDNPRAVIRLDDIQGMLILWLVGLALASAIAIVECVISFSITYRMLDMVYFVPRRQ